MACTGCAKAFTGEPASVSKTGAVLTGALGSNVGGQVEYWVQYGPTTSYGSNSTSQFVNTTKNVGVPVEVTLDGLTASTPYHYRLCARDSEMGGGKHCGEDATFTTQSFDCEETVTHDVTLTGNVDCTTERGIIVGANGLDIDLAGYTLRGLLDSIESFSGVEINGHDNVVVHDGKIQNWGSAIHISGNGNKVDHITTSSHYSDAIGVSGDGNEIRDSTLGSGRYFVISAHGDDVVIEDNTVPSSGAEEGFLVNGSDARIVGNEIVGGGTQPPSRGIDVVGSGALIANNVVSRWLAGDIYVTGGGHEVTGNEVFAGGAGQGPTTQAGPTSDGIFVNGFSANVLLSGNNAHDNHGDGIEVQATSAKLGDNHAEDNDDFGIDAASGVTDLGGNTANDNGNPLQCRNVFCP